MERSRSIGVRRKTLDPSRHGGMGKRKILDPRLRGEKIQENLSPTKAGVYPESFSRLFDQSGEKSPNLKYQERSLDSLETTREERLFDRSDIYIAKWRLGPPLENSPDFRMKKRYKISSVKIVLKFYLIF